MWLLENLLPISVCLALAVIASVCLLVRSGPRKGTHALGQPSKAAALGSSKECWEYIDAGNVKRGPFSGAQMLLWFQRQFLPTGLSVRHTASMPFTSIDVLFHPPLLPFMSRPDFKSMSAAEVSHCDGPCWEYLDPKGFARGIFSDADMSLWHRHKMLPETLRVRHSRDMPFVSIRELFHPPLIPFKSRPDHRPVSALESHFSPRCWEYLDPTGVIQGPFLDTEMSTWRDHRMLPDTLHVRYACCMPFVPLTELFHPPLLCFRSRPSLDFPLSLVVSGNADDASEGDDDLEADDADELKGVDEEPRVGNIAADSVTSEGAEMLANMRICPFDVRFSQQRARPTFRDGKQLSDTIPMIEAVHCDDGQTQEPNRASWFLKAPFPPIQVLETRCKLRDEFGVARIDPEDGRPLYDPDVQWFTLDNRRLYCYQRVAATLWPDRVFIDVIRLPPGAPSSSRQLRKFRTRDSGVGIEISDRHGVYETIHWCWRDNIESAAVSCGVDGSTAQLRRRVVGSNCSPGTGAQK